MIDLERLILRVFLGLVFVFFGVNQIFYPEKWIDLLPNFLDKTIPNSNDILKSKIIVINGVFDTIIGLFFILGFLIKIVSIISFFHLVGIVIFSLGFTPSGIRDLGLAGACLSLFFAYPDKLSLDFYYGKFRKRTTINSNNKESGIF